MDVSKNKTTIYIPEDRLEECFNIALGFQRATRFTKEELKALIYEATELHIQHGGDYWHIFEHRLFVRSIDWGKLPQQTYY